MEPHPIPQNITSFQFKLVGDMTLKQFVYLAVGCGIAYLLFVFLASTYPVVVWPLIIISASMGAAFAFLPIGFRPLDYWLQAFLKAIYSPTRGAWQKNGKNFAQDPLFKSRYVMYRSSLQIPLVGLTQPVTPSVTPSTSVPAQDLPTQEELKKTVDLAREAQALQVKIIQTERTLNQLRTEVGQPTPIPIDYSREVNKILADLQRLVAQASAIRSELDTIGQPQAEVPGPEVTKAKVRVVIPVKPKPQQIALTSFPNVINGIVKDGASNYLEGVVVVIYDKEGLPVRALKTNKLGQFSGATPLPNGTYTLELEKDGFTFDVLQIELAGMVLPPLVVTAK